ncbi:MAG: CRISPR-associated endonuclease Cas2 [Candidatus Berkelbacteria bacterium]|nr:CRISPR-associated endonuclease Cas2 [Candidatus Berkelbacteria bacterium]
MDEATFEKAKLYSEQILFYFLDFNLTLFEIFDPKHLYRIPLEKYDDFRFENKKKFSKTIYRLKQQKFIKKYYKDKNCYLELTAKGKKLVKKYLIDELKIKKPKLWDKKWRLVIFDIPNNQKNAREILRNKLETLGFFKLQESVYVYPFECREEVNFLKNQYYLSGYVQYITADNIETEINLIKKFLSRGVLKEKMIP